ncbi:MAG: DNA-protecting protein DprA [Candidatus Colwellbacteria bacterium]|nr:DNA-protecting protein DprA [Candidatus Colwellbacteria bacterium]
MAEVIKTISLGDPDYPGLLKEISDPPAKLSFRGELPTPEEVLIAVVGTRKATSLGQKIAEEISKNLAESGLTVVSGLALGIDAAAHRGAILGQGKTIAILGGGVDKIYPAQNENLGQGILEKHGAIISEYETGTPPYKDNFLRRNRIIAGLSRAVVIVEAPARSGAISTAGFAGEYGRQVFVVPGPTNHPNYVGSHSLIRDGATLVTSANDILEDLGIEKVPHRKLKAENLNGDEKTIINFLEGLGEPATIDQIIELTKLEAQVVNETLALLLIRNILKETERGYSL